MKDKKGISPLIATVLLIVLVVTVGAVIMTWVRSYTTSTISTADITSAREMACNVDTKIEISTFGNHPMACYEYEVDDTLKGGVTFENKGSVALSGYKIRWLTDAGMYENSSEDAVGIAGMKTVPSGDARNQEEFPELAAATKIIQIEIIPEITLSQTGENVYCTDSTFKTTAISSSCGDVGITLPTD